MEYFIHLKHSLKILYKSKHFPGRYRRKREWVFFSEHSVLMTNMKSHTRFRLVTKSTTLDDLEGPLRTLSKRVRLWEPTTKI